MQEKIDKIKNMYGMIHCINLTNMRPPKTVVIIISVGDFKIRWYEETLVPNIKAMGSHFNGFMEVEKTSFHLGKRPLVINYSYP